ncbi:hypothetical protein [Streptomyces sp. NPDC057301]|uniref:hypothetical protein n=1 Tax=Streptomyces sp. NPDC057301 TaxID=3346093 RepID=UPI00363903E3
MAAKVRFEVVEGASGDGDAGPVLLVASAEARLIGPGPAGLVRGRAQWRCSRSSSSSRASSRELMTTPMRTLTSTKDAIRT